MTVQKPIRPHPVTIKTYGGFSAHSRGVYVEALTSTGKQVGFLEVEQSLRGECGRDLKSLSNGLGKPHMRLFIVEKSEITNALYRNTGVGIEMYLAAAKFVAEEFGGALGPHHCEGGGGTSAAALRVWDSKRFNAVVVRHGKVVFWVGG